MKRTLSIALLCSLFSWNLLAKRICSAGETQAIHAMDTFMSQRSKPELVSEEVVGERRNYTKFLYTIKAKNQGKERESKFYFYKTRRGFQAQKPTVILFSTVGGVTLLERYVAFYLAKKGISTVVAELSDIEQVDQLEKVSPYLVSSLFSSLNITDFAASMPDVDSNKMATIGLSLGGFRALYLSALDMRIKSATLIVSGASITKTIGASTLNLVEEIRGKQMDDLGLDPNIPEDKKEYVELLNDEIMFKVEHVLCRRDTSSFLLFQSKRDTIVPYEEQESLYNMLGQPTREVSNHFGHRGTAVVFGLAKLSTTTDFLFSQWNLASKG